ncbi:hypothetical protein D1872_351740 [compost metagenome]
MGKIVAFFCCAFPPQDSIAMRKAAEAFDKIIMITGIGQGVSLTQCFIKFKRRFLVFE